MVDNRRFLLLCLDANVYDLAQSQGVKDILPRFKV